ncbi:hypothetical protein KCP74_03315 [Salmonella enterica subsp. enterica]|nr:hypothetical protein KCP74_03315 [Salmonella enterica subsp. enterica]
MKLDAMRRCGAARLRLSGKAADTGFLPASPLYEEDKEWVSLCGSCWRLIAYR